MGASICVVDYQKGNLASVQRGLADAGFDAFTSTKPEDIAKADGIVIPGVGALADAMATLEETGQAQALCEAARAGKPFLGICLGLHLLLDWGDEGCPQGERVQGLGLICGHVERMESTTPEGEKLKIPHVGWNSVDFIEDGNPLFEGIPSGSYFYFTHSYCGVCDREGAVAATTQHARSFVSAVHEGNLFATQFHPEKSSSLGMRVLANFGAIVEGQ